MGKADLLTIERFLDAVRDFHNGVDNHDELVEILREGSERPESSHVE